MQKKEAIFSYNSYSTIENLNANDKALMLQARENTKNAYAPYSKFNVSAVARLVNGQIITGTNFENASFPVGICAERALISAISSLYPKAAIDTMAISYHNEDGESKNPVSPCGMCRQALNEYEQVSKHPIRLLLSGMEGEVLEIKKSSQLLPLSFNASDL